MRRRLVLAFLLVAGGATGTTTLHSQSPHAASQAAAGWSDVAPILSTHCVGCHTSGGIAPFPLTTAAAAKQHAQDILRVTQRRIMPP